MGAPSARDLRDRDLAAYDRETRTKQIAGVFQVSQAWANGDVFEAFVEQALTPELRPGDAAIMDNLSSHKRRRVRDLIEQVGARLVFLPPYSPDLNPIERIFSKIKQTLGSPACGTRHSLWCAMPSVLDQVTDADAGNCRKHCGYSLCLD